MAELLSAGIFIEERQTQAQVIEAVSTSNMGIVGFSPQGPTDTARLVTSLDEYFTVFGPLTKKSLLGTSMVAFFTNGGKRAFVVRVMPSDAILGDARIESTQYDVVLARGDGVTVLFQQADGAVSILKDTAPNGAATPLVPSSISLQWRATAPAVTAVPAATRDASASLQLEDAVPAYDGIIDRKANLIVPGATSPNGDVLFRSVQDNPPIPITITVVVAGLSTALSVSVLGTAITINAATDGGGLVTTTAAALVTFLTTSPTAAAVRALVSFIALGTGLGLLAAFGTAPLVGGGYPVFDPRADSFVPGSVTFSWTHGGAPRSLLVTASATSSVVTVSGGAGADTYTVTFDHRSGRFSFLFAGTEIPAPADDGVLIQAAYTPTTATITADTGTTQPPPVDGTGKVGLFSSSLASGGGIGNASWVNVVDGTWSVTFAAGATNIPHGPAVPAGAGARVFIQYEINAWDLQPISKGVWSSDVKVQILGAPDAFQAATANFARYNVNVLQLNTSTLNYDVKEQYEDVSFTDPTNAAYFPDVLNQLSDLIRVVEPGGDEAPGQLSGLPRTVILAGGDGISPATPLTNQFAGAAPVASRTVVITYTQDSDSTVRTITDDGTGNLIGAVNPSYATISSTGLGPNRINYTTGEVNFRPASAVKGSTLITMSFYKLAAETNHVEQFGDEDKFYEYTLTAGPVTYSFYTAGEDGTFDTAHFSRTQFSDPSSLELTDAGMFAFNKVDELLQLIIPDFAGDATVSSDMIAYAESRAQLPSGGDRFCIFTVPRGSDAQEAVDWVRFTLNVKSKYAAVYWPWVRFADPLNNNRPTVIPPLGHIAGIYARTDNNKNVGKAPAGTVDGQILGIIGLELDTTQGMRDFVYPYRVNPLISTPQTGRAVWGSRTLSATTDWRNVNAVRLFMFVEKSVYNSTFWIVFENNGPALWTRIKTQLVGFLNGLFIDGYFAGKTPSEAFFVIVDDSNNIQATIDQGQVIIDVGMAPNKPAEFVRFRFQQLSA